MPTTIPNLWPEKYRIDIQTPLTILRVQAGLLRQVTSGILEGNVETETAGNKIQHRLVVIAPAYNGYRHTLIKVIHERHLPYPVEVQATGLGKTEEAVDQDSGEIYPETIYPIAYNDDELQALVKQVLRSGPTDAIVTSLIAKSTEPKEASEATDESND